MNVQEFATNWIIFVCFFSCNIIKVNYFLHYFVILLHLVSSFSHNKILLAPYAYVSTESIHFIISSSLALNTILLTSSVNALYFSLLNLCWDFNINLLFVWIVYDFFNPLYVLFIFLVNLFYFQFELLLNNFYNLQFSIFFLWYTLSFLLLSYLHDCCLLIAICFCPLCSRLFHYFPA